jgi:hypothetical protein
MVHRAKVGWGNSRMTVLSSIERGQAQLFPKWNWKKRGNVDAPSGFWSDAGSVTHPSPAGPRLSTSNRYTARIEITVTYSKQTTAVLSNRYKRLSPGGVPSGLPPCPALCCSNRNTPETGIAVTPTKQTTAVLSNRNKKTPPGEYLDCKQFRRSRRLAAITLRVLTPLGDLRVGLLSPCLPFAAKAARWRRLCRKS